MKNLMKIFIFAMIIILGLKIILTAINKNENKNIMPKGFEKVYLGMSLEELKNVRPNLKINRDMDDPRKVADTHIESNIDNPFLNYVMYFFKENKLNFILFGNDFKDENSFKKYAENIDKLRKRFIAGCIKKWGKHYFIKISKGEENKQIFEDPIIIWEKSNIRISAFYIPSLDVKGKEYKISKETVPTFFWISIAYLSDYNDSSLRTPKNTEIKYLFKDLTDIEQNKVKIEEPIFE